MAAMCKTVTVDTTEQRRRPGWTTENSEALSRSLIESTRLWLLFFVDRIRY